MRRHCHQSQRATRFVQSNVITHTLSRRVGHGEARRSIDRFEGYLYQLQSQHGPNGVVHLPHTQFPLRVEFSGTVKDGRVVARGGNSLYAEIRYQQRGIHVYRASNDASFMWDETALFLDRRLPAQSRAFGTSRQLEWLPGVQALRKPSA